MNPELTTPFVPQGRATHVQKILAVAPWPQTGTITMKTINVIGCGNVGKTLSRLWVEHSLLRVQAVLNRSTPSATQAIEFVGSGRPVDVSTP